MKTLVCDITIMPAPSAAATAKVRLEGRVPEPSRCASQTIVTVARTSLEYCLACAPCQTSGVAIENNATLTLAATTLRLVDAIRANRTSAAMEATNGQSLKA